MKKVSILMPSYNDALYIERTMDSVLKQKYENWELLICDDGSNDNTKEVVENYIKKNKMDNKIKYFYQENADQLNAIINLISHITGDYVYILHSDDLLYNEFTLFQMVEYMNNNDVDSIIGDVTIIDKNDNVTGIQKISNYIYKKRIIPLQLLWLGRNLYVDMAFHKKEIFVNQVYQNYLLWNGPFWLNLNTNDILNVKKVDFSFFKYRVFDDNYINMEGANLNIINGEIRVVTRLLKNYYIPFYKVQYLLYRLFNKMNLGINYPVIYLNKETKNKSEIINFVLGKRFKYKEIEENIFLNALSKFYLNFRTRKIYIDNINAEYIYYGKDMRLFNKDINTNKLSNFYHNFLEEMEKGFDEIIVNSKDDLDKMINITKFLCIYPYIKITIKDK